MQPIRVFADHYQFYLFDSEYDHYSDERLTWKDENRGEYGYLSTENAIYISTVADLNDHRVRLYLDEKPTGGYDRIYENRLNIPSGKLVISSPAYSAEEHEVIEIEPGVYEISICSNSLGKDMLSFEREYDEEMEDEEFFKNDEFEYYDIYLAKTA